MGKQIKTATTQKEDETAKLERDIKTGEYWLIGINALLLIANIVIASIYYGQLCQMRKATKAAEGANGIASRALIETDRSWVEIRLSGDWVKPIEFKKGLAQLKHETFPLTFTNIGKFPVKEIKMEGNAEFVEQSTPISVQTFHWSGLHPKMGMNILFPERHGDFTVGIVRKDYPQGGSLFADFSADDKNLFTKGSKYFIVYVRATFIDGFGKHWVEFCEPLVVPNTPAKYGDCINYNDAGDGDPPWTEIWP